MLQRIGHNVIPYRAIDKMFRYAAVALKFRRRPIIFAL